MSENVSGGHAWNRAIPDLGSALDSGNETGQAAQAPWSERRSDILNRLLSLSGGVPDLEPVTCIAHSSTKTADGIIVNKISYSTFQNDRVSAYLLLPPDAERGSKLPAVLALHPTSTAAKDEVAGFDGKPDNAYGIELARRGFIVLAPDTLTAGERVFEGWKPYQSAPFEERYPDWSMIGKMMYDHRQGVELLCGLESVDQGRIAAIGHSLGGYNAFLLAAIEERVKAIVVSCGFSTFAGDEKPERWGERKQWFTHFPKLNDYLQQGRFPFEFNEILALTFPRAAFVWYTQNDAIFPHWEPIGQAIKTVRDFYAQLGQEDRFAAYMGVGEHEFPPPARELAYRWLERQLAARA
ncbi:MAG: dipeptidyl aminopeptidase [Paenibacillus sp.]|nr:dipeptidyl aminopeptidase [Paenibacillus sp.]